MNNERFQKQGQSFSREAFPGPAQEIAEVRIAEAQAPSSSGQKSYGSTGSKLFHQITSATAPPNRHPAPKKASSPQTSPNGHLSLIDDKQCSRNLESKFSQTVQTLVSKHSTFK